MLAAAMYEEWFHSKLDQRYNFNAAPFKDLLSGHITAKEVAERLASFSPSTRETTDTKLWRLWSMIFDAASELQDTHPTLVDLLAAFEKLPEQRLEGETINWPARPSFSAIWRDRHDSKSPFSNALPVYLANVSLSATGVASQGRRRKWTPYKGT